MAVLLQRQVFEISRAAEYFSVRELQAQTGQMAENFAQVVLKELVYNALDACETAGVTPEISIEVSGQDTLTMVVTDNGRGLSSATIRRILNFSTRTSDKAGYRSPTRGAQKNALKTILGIPQALGSQEPVIIESQGVRHTIKARIDPAGNLQIDHQQKDCDCKGTKVAVTLPGEDQIFFPMWWGKAYALLNPHALVRIRQFDDRSEHANFEDAKTWKIYHPSVDFPGSWRKWLPTDPTAIHLYESVG